LSKTRKALLWMAGLSLVSLLLGLLREFWIARELRASGEADLFFRGLVVVGAARGFGLALFRARWIPVPAQAPARMLLRAEAGTCVVVTGIALVALALIAGAGALTDPTLWVFAAAVLLSTIGSAVRALAERAGKERRGFVLEWALPIGAITGALTLPHGALGPALGILVGLVIGFVGLLPVVFSDMPQGTLPAGHVVEVVDRGRTRVLLFDALVYTNLGLLEGALSHVFATGGFALLNYAYLFVNAALMVPSAAATVVGLRASASGDPRAHATMRRWSVVAGLVCAGLVIAVGLLLGWAPVATRVDAAVGWPMAAGIGAVVLWSAPYAGLRLANTIGRQFVIATEPRRVVVWDLIGLVGRALLLLFAMQWLGLLASPIGLAFAESVQLLAWWRRPQPRPATA
jgi:hypothetical protein